MKVDDPVGAVAVHGGCGMLGTLCVGLFAVGTETCKAKGLFYGGGFTLLGKQLIGVASVASWTAVTMTIVFLIIKHTLGLRVNAEEEIVGLDKMEHGIDSSYSGFVFENEFAGGMTLGINGSLSLNEAVPLEIRKKTKLVAPGYEGKITKIVVIIL